MDDDGTRKIRLTVSTDVHHNLLRGYRPLLISITDQRFGDLQRATSQELFVVEKVTEEGPTGDHV